MMYRVQRIVGRVAMVLLVCTLAIGNGIAEVRKGPDKKTNPAASAPKSKGKDPSNDSIKQGGAQGEATPTDPNADLKPKDPKGGGQGDPQSDPSGEPDTEGGESSNRRDKAPSTNARSWSEWAWIALIGGGAGLVCALLAQLFGSRLRKGAEEEKRRAIEAQERLQSTVKELCEEVQILGGNIEHMRLQVRDWDARIRDVESKQGEAAPTRQPRREQVAEPKPVGLKEVYLWNKSGKFFRTGEEHETRDTYWLVSLEGQQLEGRLTPYAPNFERSMEQRGNLESELDAVAKIIERSASPRRIECVRPGRARYNGERWEVIEVAQIKLV